MRWTAGEATVERLIEQKHIERVEGAQADGEARRARNGMSAR